jgi:hypothetical protein
MDVWKPPSPLHSNLLCLFILPWTLPPSLIGLRRASKEAQNLKANNLPLHDEDGNDVASLLLGHFKHYLADRFPTLNETIRDRIAHTMVLRRKRVLYRRSRQLINLTKNEEVAPRTSAPVAPTTATTLVVGQFLAVSSTRSVSSTTKTVALANHEPLVFPPAPGTYTRRKHERLKAQWRPDHEAHLKSEDEGPEEVLKTDWQAMAEVTCPYCCQALPSEKVLDDKTWQ